MKQTIALKSGATLELCDKTSSVDGYTIPPDLITPEFDNGAVNVLASQIIRQACSSGLRDAMKLYPDLLKPGYFISFYKLLKDALTDKAQTQDRSSRINRVSRWICLHYPKQAKSLVFLTLNMSAIRNPVHAWAFAVHEACEVLGTLKMGRGSAKKVEEAKTDSAVVMRLTTDETTWERRMRPGYNLQYMAETLALMERISRIAAFAAEYDLAITEQPYAYLVRYVLNTAIMFSAVDLKEPDANANVRADQFAEILCNFCNCFSVKDDSTDAQRAHCDTFLSNVRAICGKNEQD